MIIGTLIIIIIFILYNYSINKQLYQKIEEVDTYHKELRKQDEFDNLVKKYGLEVVKQYSYCHNNICELKYKGIPIGYYNRDEVYDIEEKIKTIMLGEKLCKEKNNNDTLNTNKKK